MHRSPFYVQLTPLSDVENTHGGCTAECERATFLGTTGALAGTTKRLWATIPQAITQYYDMYLDMLSNLYGD